MTVPLYGNTASGGLGAVLSCEFYYAYFSPDFHFYAKGRGFFG